MIECLCPECDPSYEISNELAGKSVHCPECHIRIIPRVIPQTRKHREGVEEGSMIACCHHCGKKDRVPENAGGRQAQCPSCAKTFEVTDYLGHHLDKPENETEERHDFGGSMKRKGATLFETALLLALIGLAACAAIGYLGGWLREAFTKIYIVIKGG